MATPHPGGTRWAVPATAAAVVLMLAAFSSAYGYHRDELYFLAAGRHLAWGYADQGPLTPLLARLMSEFAPGSLTVLRLPSALAAGATVLLTARLAREFSGGRRAELIAAACAATATIVVFDGHLLSTSTFDLLVWTTVSWLVVRLVRTGERRWWPAVGAVLGVGLLNKPLPAFLALGLVAGVLIAGPQRLLRDRYVWLGASIAVLMWSPWLIWQATHGWPQLAVSRSIAGGGSASSQPWWAIVPFQFLLVSPLLAPVWIAGLAALFRDRALRPFRFLAWAWLVLAVVFMATGGKPYYLSGVLPALLGAGAASVDRWLSRGRAGLRRGVLVAAVALSALSAALIALPILPAPRAGAVVAVNADVGETIGWPDLVRTVAAVRRTLPAEAPVIVLTSNYGEAGAIDRFGPALGLPRAFSGHNAYSAWGPPPDGSAPVLAIGSRVTRYLRGCTVVARITNRADIANDESGQPVSVCAAPRRAWSAEWPRIRHYG